jgi:hypothetical protein
MLQRKRGSVLRCEILNYIMVRSYTEVFRGNPAFPLRGHCEWLKTSLTGDDTRQGDTEFNAASIRWKAFDLLP